MKVISGHLKEQFHQEVKEWLITEDILNRTDDEVMSVLKQVHQQMLKLGEIFVKYPDYKHYLPVENNGFELCIVNRSVNVMKK
jgi:hypothetical protein